MSGSMIFGFELVLPFVCKLNATGDFLWGKYYNYPPGFVERSSFQFIRVGSMSNIQMAGYTDKFGAGSTDFYVVDIDNFRIQFDDVGANKPLKLGSKMNMASDRLNEGVFVPPADLARARSQAEAVRRSITERAPAIAEKKALIDLHQGRLFS